MNKPCFGCPIRTPGCHSTCEGYKTYREELEAAKGSYNPTAHQFDDYQFQKSWDKHKKVR